MSTLTGKLIPGGREQGYGVIIVKPYLFNDVKDFFKEVKSLFLEYLTKEEEERVKELLFEGNGFFALVPKKEYEKAENGAVMKYGEVDTAYTLDTGCFCQKIWTEGCCGSVSMGKELGNEVRRQGDRIRDDRLKEYFISGRN